MASTFNSGAAFLRPFILACAAALAASQIRMRDSCRNCAVSTRGLVTTSTAPASMHCISVSDPAWARPEQMTTGMGRCDMILRRNVSPSMRGISMSRKITSGTSCRIFSTAT
ncbi:hypothetical protein FQZ97_1200720 [compost metagenome]